MTLKPDELYTQVNTLTYQPTAGIVEDGEAHWWNSRGSVWASEVAGESVSNNSILTSTTCFACTKVLSEVIASLPASIMRRMKKNQREEMVDHRAFDLLCDMPNPEVNAFTFWEMATTRTVNTGNFYCEIQRDGADRPVGLWPIHPSRVRPVRMPDGSLYWEVSGDYTGMPEFQDPSWRVEHGIRLIANRDMLNVVGFGSENGLIGPGIAPGAQEIGVELAARRYGAEFFSSGGLPLGFAEHPGWQNDAGKRRIMREDLNDVKNRRGQIGILWEGMKWNSIGITPEQAQCLESRRYTSHQICALYNVPPPIIGDFRDSKYSNAGEAIRQFVLITVRNLVERMERSINTQVMKVRVPGKLVSAFSDKTIFRMTLDGLLRGDPKTQAETWQIYRQSGVASANDVLRDLDMNEIQGPEGEYRIVPGGYTRLEQIDNQGNRLDKKPVEEKTPEKEAYNKDYLIAGLEQAAHENKPMVHGSDIVKDSIDTVVESVVDRINDITTTQVERWREKDPKEVESKLPEFFARQSERLKEALSPADQMCLRIGLSPISTKVAEEFQRVTSSLDYHKIFDEKARKLIWKSS
jgi:HK97 family phage portal protein